LTGLSPERAARRQAGAVCSSSRAWPPVAFRRHACGTGGRKEGPWRINAKGRPVAGRRRPCERHLDGCAGIGALLLHSAWEHADGGHFIPEASPMAATSNAPKVQRAVLHAHDRRKGKADMRFCFIGRIEIQQKGLGKKAAAKDSAMRFGEDQISQFQPCATLRLRRCSKPGSARTSTSSTRAKHVLKSFRRRVLNHQRALRRTDIRVAAWVQGLMRPRNPRRRRPVPQVHRARAES
jgi:hypothetical protein